MRFLLPAALGLWTIAALAAGAGKPLACAQCHRAQSAHQAESDMTRALLTGSTSEVLKSHSKLVFRQGPFSYTIDRRGSQSWYTVSDGKSEISTPIDWAFGLGAAGQTYVFRRNNAWYESRVSYYRETDALDLTVGARKEVPENLEDAAGRWLSTRGADECFNCHATQALDKGVLHTESLTPGVQCQRCHEGAEAHLAAFQQPGSAANKIPRRLSQLTAEELSDFCGQCHRTWAQIAADGPHNVNNVRFQPYRLTNSKCYDSTDARIRCTACHDPHTQLVRAVSFYDSRCLACHATAGGKAGAKICKVASQNCADCHLPKVRIAEAHNGFTDHWIRIAKPGGPYPN